MRSPETWYDGSIRGMIPADEGSDGSIEVRTYVNGDIGSTLIVGFALALQPEVFKFLKAGGGKLKVRHTSEGMILVGLSA